MFSRSSQINELFISKRQKTGIHKQIFIRVNLNQIQRFVDNSTFYYSLQRETLQPDFQV